MAEFKFSCPQCSQHIQCDTGYAGQQINCPTCQQAIIVPQAPESATPPPPPQPVRSPLTPSGLTPGRSPAAPSGERPFPGAPSAQPVQAKSHALRNVLVITAVVVVLAALGFGGWFGYSKYKAGQAKKGNPAAQVATPTAAAAIQALSILTKVHSAYTNFTSVKADGTFTLFLVLSNLTVADVSPNQPANAKNASRHPPGMPKTITSTTELSVKQTKPDLYYFAGEAVSKIDRMTMTNTFAFWKSDKGQFMFMDSHQKMMPPSYRQLADGSVTNKDAGQFKKLQELFADPANLTKIIKDLGQTDDESANGQDCYTLTAKILGQKVKIWVDKTSYLIPQWQITLGGAINDADIDDAFSLYESAFTNMPPMALEMIKMQVKKMTPMMAKIRGTITSTSRNVEINPSLSAADFNYPAPRGVRLSVMPQFNRAGSASSSKVSQRNACINNLRQLDAAKNQFALEKGKTNGDAVTEADIKPYIALDATGNLPKCPAGGKYTLGKIGESPTCSIPDHLLP